ncbi:MAG TPA: hypothetical protein VHJ78_07765 [Actinomycetota bacterium]|nr:hypothetical protein [Actinomycetota bacterium]
MPALRRHSTETSDKSWDGPKAETKLGGDAKSLRKAHAWVDPDGDPSTKVAYKFLHHEVDTDGRVGAANVKAASSGIGVLNGGRGGADIPKKDRKGVYDHLAKHLEDAGKEPPELK